MATHSCEVQRPWRGERRAALSFPTSILRGRALTSLRAATLIVTISLAASACTDAAPDEVVSPPPVSASSAPASATEAAEPQQECDETADQLVQTLVDALAQGDVDAAMQVFAAPEDFEWFSATTADNHFVAYNHEDLRDHLGDNYDGDTSVELTQFNWNGVRADKGNFDHRLTVGGADTQVEWVGKGSLLCSDATLIVWSMGTDDATNGTTDDQTEESS